MHADHACMYTYEVCYTKSLGDIHQHILSTPNRRHFTAGRKDAYQVYHDHQNRSSHIFLGVFVIISGAVIPDYL